MVSLSSTAILDVQQASVDAELGEARRTASGYRRSNPDSRLTYRVNRSDFPQRTRSKNVVSPPSESITVAVLLHYTSCRSNHKK